MPRSIVAWAARCGQLHRTGVRSSARIHPSCRRQPVTHCQYARYRRLSPRCRFCQDSSWGRRSERFLSRLPEIGIANSSHSKRNEMRAGFTSEPYRCCGRSSECCRVISSPTVVAWTRKLVGLRMGVCFSPPIPQQSPLRYQVVRCFVHRTIDSERSLFHRQCLSGRHAVVVK